MYSERLFSQGKDWDAASQQELAEPSQQEPSDDRLPSRADVIVEENRQMSLYMENTLKQISKKRIQLLSKRKNTDTKLNALYEKQERQKQKLVDMQMIFEKEADKYCFEVGQRPAIQEKLDKIIYIVNVIHNNYSKGIEIGEDMRTAINHISSRLEEFYEKSKIFDKNELKKSFGNKMNHNLSKVTHLRDKIIEDRNVNLNEIKSLAQHQSERTGENQKFQQEIVMAEKYHNDLVSSVDVMSLENEQNSEEINKLQCQIDEFRVLNNSQIQNLKLQLNTEENSNTILEASCSEKENKCQALSNKHKELTNLSSQMKAAITETRAHNSKLEEEIDECRKQNMALTAEISFTAESMQKYGEVETLNTTYRSSVSNLEHILNTNNVILREKESTMNSCKAELNELREILKDLEENLAALKQDLANTQADKKLLERNAEDKRLLYEEERKNKATQTQCLLAKKAELTEEIKKISSDVEKAKEHIKELKAEEEEVNELLEKHLEISKENNAKILGLNNVCQHLSSDSEHSLSKKYEELNNYRELIKKEEHVQNKLPEVLQKKINLEHEIVEQSEKDKNERDSLLSDHASKIQAMDKENENYSVIMKKLLLAEENTIQKIKEDIKLTEENKVLLETHLKKLAEELNSLKVTETSKRTKITKMESRLKTINQEIKVTRQDVYEAISGKFQGKRNTYPTSSPVLINQEVYEPPEKKVAAYKADFNILSQSNTKKWLETIPLEEDEFEFSEV